MSTPSCEVQQSLVSLDMPRPRAYPPSPMAAKRKKPAASSKRKDVAKKDVAKKGSAKNGSAKKSSAKSDGAKKGGATHGSSTERPGDRVIEAEFLSGATSADQFPPPAFSEIAFAGRSNVGKSSLMNCLTQRHGLVRTSSTPGCTRQVSWFRSTSDDKAVIDLVDLPGYGYAKRSKSERNEWASLIESYLLERPTLRGVVILVDARRGFEADDAELLEMLSDAPRVNRPPLEITLVATKLDKLPLSKHKPTISALEKQVGRRVIGFSADKGIGRVPLWRSIRRIAGVAANAEEAGVIAPESSESADITPKSSEPTE